MALQVLLPPPLPQLLQLLPLQRRLVPSQPRLRQRQVTPTLLQRQRRVVVQQVLRHQQGRLQVRLLLRQRHSLMQERELPFQLQQLALQEHHRSLPPPRPQQKRRNFLPQLQPATPLECQMRLLCRQQ